VLCSDNTKKLSRRVSAEETETSHKSLNLTLTEAADHHCTNKEALTPRGLRYARRSGGLVEPDSNQLNKRRSSGTTKPSAGSTQTSVGTSKITGQRGCKRRSTESSASETPSKRARKDSSKSPSASLFHRPKQAGVAKKQAASQRSTKISVRKSADRQRNHKISNLERGKGKTSKSDKVSSKATAAGHQPSAGATAVGHIPVKKHLQRSTAAATASVEASSAVVAGETVTGGTSDSGRVVTRRAATKRGGTLLSSSSHLTDTTGSCASSK